MRLFIRPFNLNKSSYSSNLPFIMGPEEEEAAAAGNPDRKCRNQKKMRNWRKNRYHPRHRKPQRQRRPQQQLHRSRYGLCGRHLRSRQRDLPTKDCRRSQSATSSATEWQTQKNHLGMRTGLPLQHSARTRSYSRSQPVPAPLAHGLFSWMRILKTLPLPTLH
jgi:hypothetical protein